LSQIPFDFEHEPSLAAADYVIGACNAAAAAWVARWPDWPAPALAIHGPPGSGKTHLGRVWVERARARVVAVAELAAIERIPALVEGAAGLLVDDVDRDLDARRERGLLHLYNLVAERRGHLLLLGLEAPARWPLMLADLRSRLAAIPAVAIGAPDDAILEAVLAKLFTDRQLAVASDLVRYIAARIERSFAAARAVVAALDRETLAAGQGVTLPRVRALLARQGLLAFPDPEDS
jgi:chromosomal replication initiation ATPase DnaA